VLLPQASMQAPALLVPRRKPLGPVKIDWSHRYTKGLTFYLYVTPKGQLVDLVANKAFPAVDATRQFGPNGAELYFNGSTDAALIGDDPRWDVTNTNLSCMWAFTGQSTGAQQMICSKDSSTTGRSWISSVTSAATKTDFGVAFLPANNDYSSFVSPDGCWTIGKEAILAAHITSITACAGWADGVPVTMTKTPEQTADTFTVQATSTAVYLGYRPYSGFNNRLTGSISWYAQWFGSPYFDNVMAASMARNPYQILIPA